MQDRDESYMEYIEQATQIDQERYYFKGNIFDYVTKTKNYLDKDNESGKVRLLNDDVIDNVNTFLDALPNEYVDYLFNLEESIKVEENLVQFTFKLKDYNIDLVACTSITDKLISGWAVNGKIGLFIFIEQGKSITAENNSIESYVKELTNKWEVNTHQLI